MSRIAYVNGRYLPSRDAAVNFEDRGFQFADGVYEVCEVRGGRVVDQRRHLDRLRRSLDALRIAAPMSDLALSLVMRETLRRNRVGDGLIYLQVTRGVARRDHLFPPPGTRPSLVITARNRDPAINAQLAAQGISVVTVPENRWPRVDIKSIALVPNVLAKQAAREQGAREAWFVDRGGFITEGASTNAWIVTGGGRVVTRAADTGILPGITRAVLVEAIAAQGLILEERAFGVDEAYAAREAFATAATQIVMPVIRIDGRTIGDGKPGPVASRLRAVFHAYAEID